MTKFVIAGIRYDMGQALYQPPIGAVNELREEYGILPRDIKTQFETLGDARQREDFDADEFMYSSDFQKAFFGLIFLGKRRAGEKVSLEQVRDQVAELSYADIDFVNDEVVPDPKEQATSDPADESEPDTTPTPS